MLREKKYYTELELYQKFHVEQSYKPDFGAFIIYAAVQIVKKFLEGVLAAILTVCTKAAGTVAIIAAAVGTILIIYLKWDAIVIFVSGLF